MKHSWIPYISPIYIKEFQTRAGFEPGTQWLYYRTWNRRTTRTLYRYATTTALEVSLSYATMFALVKSTDSVLIPFWNILQETGRCLFSTDSVLKHSLRNWKVLIQCWFCSETFFKKPEGTESMLILFWSIRLLTVKLLGYWINADSALKH